MKFLLAFFARFARLASLVLALFFRCTLMKLCVCSSSYCCVACVSHRRNGKGGNVRQASRRTSRIANGVATYTHLCGRLLALFCLSFSFICSMKSFLSHHFSVNMKRTRKHTRIDRRRVCEINAIIKHIPTNIQCLSCILCDWHSL